MHSVKSYLERRDLKELQALLLSYCEGYAEFDAETALLICRTIAGKDPRKNDPMPVFIRLCLRYTY